MNIRFAFVVFLGIAAIAGAQHKAVPADPVDQVVALRYGDALVNSPKNLTDLLNLTPAERKQIDSINSTYDAKIKADFQTGKDQPPDLQRLQPVFEGRWKELYAVLTRKQKAVLKKWVDARNNALRRPPPRQSGDPHLNP